MYNQLEFYSICFSPKVLFGLLSLPRFLILELAHPAPCTFNLLYTDRRSSSLTFLSFSILAGGGG